MAALNLRPLSIIVSKYLSISVLAWYLSSSAFIWFAFASPIAVLSCSSVSAASICRILSESIEAALYIETQIFASVSVSIALDKYASTAFESLSSTAIQLKASLYAIPFSMCGSIDASLKPCRTSTAPVVSPVYLHTDAIFPSVDFTASLRSNSQSADTSKKSAIFLSVNTSGKL